MRASELAALDYSTEYAFTVLVLHVHVPHAILQYVCSCVGYLMLLLFFFRSFCRSVVM